MRGIDVTLNKINDFVVNNQIAEVKSIHDDYNRSEFDQTNGLLTKSIPNSYRIADLFDEICTKLLQKKWYDHLSKAIAKQKGKMVFVNATQSHGLGRVSVFIEEHKLQSGIKEMIQKAMDFINKKDVIPVIITMEAIHNLHIVSSVLFLLPIKTSGVNAEIDMKRFNKSYLMENLFL